MEKPGVSLEFRIRGEEKRFAISFGIIDVLMHQDESCQLLQEASYLTFFLLFSLTKLCSLDKIGVPAFCGFIPKIIDRYRCRG